MIDPDRRKVYGSCDELEAAVAAVAGQVQFSRGGHRQFQAKLSAARLSKVGFLSIDSSALRARIDEAHGFFGLTVGLNGSFSVSEGSRLVDFDRGTGHILFPDRTFDFRTKRPFALLGTNFFLDLPDYARQLHCVDGAIDLSGTTRLSLVSVAGSALVRYLTFIWGEILQGGGILESELARSEIEDGLIAAMVWAMEGNRGSQDDCRCADTRIARAEDYIASHVDNPISRTELTAIAGVSARTLSRGFVKRHGVGPMGFLRQRRMEAARIDLLFAEPDDTSVSEVALRYGYAQPGKFAAVYKAIFHETPSETLRR